MEYHHMVLRPTHKFVPRPDRWICRKRGSKGGIRCDYSVWLDKDAAVYGSFPCDWHDPRSCIHGHAAVDISRNSAIARRQILSALAAVFGRVVQSRAWHQ